MPLTDDNIDECYKRYLREQDRYIKMAEVTYEKCLYIVQKKLTIRATVQRRAKNPRSFVEKLKKPEKKGKYSSVDDVFEKISDLAGVRIATYLESDREAVVEEVKKEFVSSDGGEPNIDKKDNDLLGKHYRATHCQVYLPEEDLGGNNENLKGTTCEIQVCSLLAHVFNEIEHDLQYKPLTGELSPAESEFIHQLGLLTQAGDITIKRLLEETDSRLKDRTGQFSDVYDFVARMRKELDLGPEFSSNAGQLFEELMTLNLKTPEAIRGKVLDNNENLPQYCQNQYEILKEIFKKDQTSINLEDGSSDILLAGILKNTVDEILKNHPMGRGMGRPSRLAQIANAYRKNCTTNSLD
jgi:ppGpp synthetase/RelA/SpoT-type nucleotidyltranferase